MFKKKNISKNDNLIFYLAFSAFFHLSSCLCSIFSDYKNNDSQIFTLEYFSRFLTWWSFHASLFTFFTFFYVIVKKYFFHNKINSKKGRYWEQILYVITNNANLVSMIIFFSGVFSDIFFLKEGKRSIPVSKNEKIFYWIYTICWHFIAPSLWIKYFCNIDLSLLRNELKHNESGSFIHIFSHPLIYFLFLVFRGANSITIRKKYPYGFIETVMEKKSSFLENFYFELTFSLFFYLLFYLISIFSLKFNEKFFIKKIDKNKVEIYNFNY
ncbi:MAG: hypothetical protein AM1032_000219 [Mycoplasmataceae bacterium]|nr:MAG: hypothetical protein AM1032_000219 [Mycoplasmataceae bacterium]